MKTRNKIKNLIAFLCLSLAVIFCFSACTGDGGKTSSSSSTPATPGEDGLTKIELFRKPSKTAYFTGETFDPSGMVVKSFYEDGRTANVLYSDCTYKTEPLSKEDKEIAITYGSQSTAVEITVTDVPEIKDDDKPELKRLVLVRNPSKTEYLVGEAFDPMGVLIKAVFTDGSELPLPIADLTYPKQALTEADTEITIEYQGLTVTVNITIEKYPVKIITSDAAVYRMEAENTDLTKYELTGWAAGRDQAESNATASNGKCLGNLSKAVGYVEYTIYSEIEEKIALYLGGANGSGATLVLKDGFSMSWNGEAFTPSGEAESLGWGLWQRILIAKVSLKKGENTLRITFNTKTAPNMDYVEFEVGNPTVVETYNVEMKSGETSWKVQAEDCEVGGTPANGKDAFTEGNGMYLCCLGKSGNTVAIKIWSDKARTVSVSMAGGHNYSGEYASLDYAKMFTANINGNTAAFGGTFTATGWTTFKEVTLGNIELNEGANLLVFNVKDVRVPNIDYFAFAEVS